MPANSNRKIRIRTEHHQKHVAVLVLARYTGFKKRAQWGVGFFWAKLDDVLIAQAPCACRPPCPCTSSPGGIVRLYYHATTRTATRFWRSQLLRISPGNASKFEQKNRIRTEQIRAGFFLFEFSGIALPGEIPSKWDCQKRVAVLVLAWLTSGQYSMI